MSTQRNPGTQALVGFDDTEDELREFIYQKLQELLMLINDVRQYSKARELFALMRTWDLTDDELVQLHLFADFMPMSERPVHTESRAIANLLEDAYGVNTDAMNAGQFKQFVAAVIDGIMPVSPYSSGRYMVPLFGYLRLPMFTTADKVALFVKAIDVSIDRMQAVLPPPDTDEDQELLLVSLDLLAQVVCKESFAAVIGVIELCIENGYFDKEGCPPITPQQWRFGPVLTAAFDALASMLGTDLDLWMQAQLMLLRWKVELRDGYAAEWTLESFSRLLLIDA